MAKKQLQGEVISDKMEKTVIVKVRKMFFNRKYKKRYFLFKKYKAHDEKNEYKTGDKVVIEQSRPSSKEKKWIVIKKIKDKKVK